MYSMKVLKKPSGITEYSQEYLDAINNFLGFKIELSPHKNDFIINFSNISQETFEINKSKLVKITNIVHKVLKGFYEKFKNLDYQPMYKQLLVEELACNFIGMNPDNFNFLQNFIDRIKKLCNKTYELEATQMGFILIKEPQMNTKELLDYMHIDYRELDEERDIEYFLEEKQSLKLIDSKSISLVLNKSNLKVIGIAQKRSGESSIKDIMLNRFRDIEKIEITKFSYDYYLKSQIDATHKQKEFELNALKDALFDIIGAMNEEFNLGMQIEKKNILELDVLEYLNAYSNSDLDSDQRDKLIEHTNLYMSLMGNIDGVISSTIELLDSKQLFLTNILGAESNIDFVYLNKQEIFWSSSNENMIIFSNGQWKLRNYFLLRNVIARHIMLQNNIQHQGNVNIYKAFDNTQESIPKITNLFNFVKNLSDKNIGSLICLLKKDTNDLTNIANDLLVQKKVTLDKFKAILYDHKGKSLNVENCDSFLFELISSIDGAVILDKNFNILSAGEMINSSGIKNEKSYRGARTLAAIAASQFGLAIKISEDGDILIFELGDEIVRI
ncbi:diadenylate cyclase [Bacillus cereus]